MFLGLKSVSSTQKRGTSGNGNMFLDRQCVLLGGKDRSGGTSASRSEKLFLQPAEVVLAAAMWY